MQETVAYECSLPLITDLTLFSGPGRTCTVDSEVR